VVVVVVVVVAVVVLVVVVNESVFCLLRIVYFCFSNMNWEIFMPDIFKFWIQMPTSVFT